MSNLVSRSVWIAALVCTTALATGCGGDDPSTTTAQVTPTTPSTQPEPANPTADSQHPAETATPPDRPSGPRAQKMWRQVNNYGHPVPQTEADAVTAAIRRYTAAAAAADGPTACGLLANRAARALGPIGTDPKLCAEFLQGLFRRLPAELKTALRQTNTLTVRARGNQGIAYIQMPGNRTGTFPLIREQGQWRIGAISANIPTQ